MDVKKVIKIEKQRSFLRSAINEVLEDSEVTYSHYIVMCAILELKNCTPSIVSKTIGYKPAIISRLLDLLEKQSLVVRKHSKMDRRAVYVDVTPKGKKLVNNILAAIS